MEHWERFLGGLSEKVWQRFERRLDEDSRDGLTKIQETAWRRFERRLGEGSREGLAKVRERRLGEGLREMSLSRSAFLDVKRNVFFRVIASVVR